MHKFALLCAVAGAGLAVLPSAAQAQHAGGAVVFSTNQTSFTLGSIYKGSTTINGQVYQNGNTVDLTTLPAGATYRPNPASGNVRWSFYRQPYSVVIGNMEQGNNDPTNSYWYIRDVVGQNTPLAALPASGSYTYTGKTLWHDLNREGDLTYTINLATRTGSGSIANMQGGSGSSAWTGTGTLNSAPIALQADGTVGVKNGTGSLTTNNPTINFVWALSGLNPRYDLALYGPNAEEIAGVVKLSAAIGSFGIAGAR